MRRAKIGKLSIISDYALELLLRRCNVVRGKELQRGCVRNHEDGD